MYISLFFAIFCHFLPILRCWTLSVCGGPPMTFMNVICGVSVTLRNDSIGQGHKVSKSQGLKVTSLF